MGHIVSSIKYYFCSTIFNSCFVNDDGDGVDAGEGMVPVLEMTHLMSIQYRGWEGNTWYTPIHSLSPFVCSHCSKKGYSLYVVND